MLVSNSSTVFLKMFAKSFEAKYESLPELPIKKKNVKMTKAGDSNL